MADTPAASVPRLLLTGFEGFGQFAVNPSWELAQRFQDQNIEMVHVITAQLPVNWATAWSTLQAAIEQVDPRWVLMLGVGGTRRVVNAEVRGRNFTNPTRDNAGELPPPNDLIEEGGPEYRIATIPATLLAERFQESGVPAEISTDAGGFLCNWVLYKALGYAESRPGLQGVGFVHVPPLPEQGGPGVTLDQLERGLRLAIDTLVAGAAPLFNLVEAEIEIERRQEIADRHLGQGLGVRNPTQPEGSAGA
ncbi:MAG TPA: pyroglutamyl-peptidase I [Chloroflexia bacterium]